MKKIIALLLAVMMMATFAVNAFAAKSPVADEVFTVIIVNGETSSSVDADFDGKTPITLEADDEQGEFDNWSVYKADGKTEAVEGVDYIINSGSLEDATAVITPLTAVIICGNYNGVVTDPSDALDSGDKDDSNKAPQTGDTVAMTLSLVMMAAFVCGIVAKKRIAE